MIPGSRVAPRKTPREHAREPVDLQVAVSGRGLIRTLLWIVAVFTVIQAVLLVWRLGLGGQGLVRTSAFFTLDAENNLPAFFSTMLLLGCAALCAFTGRAESGRESLRPYWYLLAGVFVFLAADEATQLHEFVGKSIQRVWADRGFMQWPWVIPYLVFAAGVATTCLPFLRRLPPAIARRCIVAGAVYVGGAGGVDMIEGALSHAIRAGATQLVPLSLTLPIIEEPMEMIGIILFMAAILRYLADRADIIRVRVTR